MLLRELSGVSSRPHSDDGSVWTRSSYASPLLAAAPPAFTTPVSMFERARRSLSARKNHVIALLYDFEWQSRQTSPPSSRVNESHVSQIKQRAISKLRLCLGEHREGQPHDAVSPLNPRMSSGLCLRVCSIVPGTGLGHERPCLLLYKPTRLQIVRVHFLHEVV